VRGEKCGAGSAEESSSCEHRSYLVCGESLTVSAGINSYNRFIHKE
jgi:hypothetical protein